MAQGTYAISVVIYWCWWQWWIWRKKTLPKAFAKSSKRTSALNLLCIV